MAEPDWDRWHELLDIGSTRAFTPAERVEYDRLNAIVHERDAECARVGEAAIKGLVGNVGGEVKA
jgi:hypothetical protein